MKRIFKRKWQKSVAIALAAIMALAGADQLIAGGLASIAQNALANLQGDSDEEVIPPSLQAYLDELQEEYDLYYEDGEDLLPPSLVGIGEVEVLEGTYEEGYTQIDSLLESFGADPSQFYAGNYGGPSPFADSFLNLSPFVLDGVLGGVIARTSVHVTNAEELRNALAGDFGALTGLPATAPVNINITAPITITSGGTVPVNGHFNDVLITQSGLASGAAHITSNQAVALTVGRVGTAVTAHIGVNVHSSVAGENAVTNPTNPATGIRVEHGATLNLRGNVHRNTWAANSSTAAGFRDTTVLGTGARAGVHVVGGSTFNFLQGYIQRFRIGVFLENSTMNMRDDVEYLPNTGAGATTVIQSNRNTPNHTETAGGTSGYEGTAGNSNAVRGAGGGVWATNNSTFNMYGGRIGTSNMTNRELGNSGWGGGGVRVYSGSTFNFRDGAISGNRSTGFATLNNEGNAASMNSRGGGGVMVYGSGSVFNMLGGYVHNNIRTSHAENWSVANFRTTQGRSMGGGGVFVGGGATFNMSGGAITENNSRRAGGVQLNNTGSTMNLSGSALIAFNVNLEDWENTGGGGIQVGHGSTLNMSGGHIYQNGSVQGSTGSDSISQARGGGVFIVNNGHMNMTGGTISDNRAGLARATVGQPGSSTVDPASRWNLLGGQAFAATGSAGGGIFVQGTQSTFTMTGGYILANQAGTGGGLAITTGGAADRINISGGWIVGNHAFNTGANGGGGGIALTRNTFATGTSNATSVEPATNAQGGLAYTLLRIEPPVIIAGNTVAANHAVGATTPEVQLQARRDDALFGSHPQVRPDLSTFNSFVGLGAGGAANWDPVIPPNAGPGGDHPMNPFNNLDIRTLSPAARNFTAVPPAVYRHIFVTDTENPTVPWTGTGTELTGDGFPIRDVVTLLSIPGWNINNSTPNPATAVAPGNLPNTFEVLDGHYWRTQQPSGAAATPVPTFQYTFAQWHRPLPIDIPSRDAAFTVAADDDGILRMSGNRMAFNMPPMPIVFYERLFRAPVRPGTIEITTPGASLFAPASGYPEGAIYLEVAQDSRPPLNDDDTPTAAPVTISIAQLLDNMGYPYRDNDNADKPDDFDPIVPAAHRYFNDLSADWEWIFDVRVYNNAGNYVETLTIEEFEDTLADGESLPFSWTFNAAPSTSPFAGRDEYQVIFSVYYNMPVNKSIVARLRVEDAHVVPRALYSNELHLVITRTDRYPDRIVVYPLGADLTPPHIAIQQNAQLRFNAVVYSQFGENISAQFPVTWTQPTIPGPDWPDNDNYLSWVPVAHVAPTEDSDGVPHNSINVTAYLDAAMGSRINFTATVPPTIAGLPEGFVAPVTSVVGNREVRIAEAPRFIADVQITNAAPSITSGNTNAKYAIIDSASGPTYYSGTASVSTLTLNRTLRSQFDEIIGVTTPTPSLHYPSASVEWTIDYVVPVMGANVLYGTEGFPSGVFIDPVTGELTVYYTAAGFNAVRVRATANSANHDKYEPGEPFFESDTILVTIVHPNRDATTVVILDNETPNTNIAQDDDGYVYARVFDQFGILMPSALVTWEVDTPDNLTLSANIPNFEENAGHNGINIAASSSAVVTDPPTVPARILTATVVGAGAVTETHSITITDTPRIASSVTVSGSSFIYYGNSPSNYAASLGSAEVHSIVLTAEVLSQFEEVLPADDDNTHWTANPNLTWATQPAGLVGVSITPDADAFDLAHLTVDYRVEVDYIDVVVTVGAPSGYTVEDNTEYTFRVYVRSTPAFKDRIEISSAAAVTAPVSIIQAGNHTFEAQVFDQFNREVENPALTWSLPSPPDYVTNAAATVNVGSEANITPVGDYFLFRATSNTQRTTMDPITTPAPIANNYAYGNIQVRVTVATRFPLIIEVMEEGETDLVTSIEVYQGWDAQFETLVRNQFFVAAGGGTTVNQPMLPLTPANNMDAATPALTWSIVGPISFPASLTNDYITIDPSTGEITIGRNAQPQTLTVRVQANDPRLDPSTNLPLEDAAGNNIYAYTEFTLYVRRTERFADVIRISTPASPYYIEYGIELETQSQFEVVVYDQFGDILPPTHEDFPNLIWNSSRDDVAVWEGPTEYRRTIRVTFVNGTVQVGEIANITIAADAPRLDNVPFALPSGEAFGTFANMAGSVKIEDSEPRPIVATILLDGVPVGGKILSPTFNPNVYTGNPVEGEPGSMEYFIKSQFETPTAPAIELERVSTENFTVIFLDRLGRVVVDPNFLAADWDIVEVGDNWSAPFYDAGAVSGSISLINETNSSVTVDVAHNAAVFGGPYPSFYIIARSRAYETDSISQPGVFGTARINIVHHDRTPVSVHIRNVITEYGEVGQEALESFPYAGGVLDIYADYEHRFIAEALDRLGYSTEAQVDWSRSTPPLGLGPNSAAISPVARENITGADFDITLPATGHVSSDSIFMAHESPTMHNHTFTITVQTVGGLPSLSDSVQVRIRSAMLPALEVGSLPFAPPHPLDAGGFGNIHLGTSSDGLSVHVFNINSSPVQSAVVSYHLNGREIYDLPPSLGSPAGTPDTPLLDESGNRVHTRWSIIDGPTDEGAFLDPTITIDPYTGYLNVSGQPGQIANRDLIGTYIYVRLEFETLPYPRVYNPYVEIRIRIADPPRVPTYVRLFTVDSPSFEFDDATEDLPLEFNAGMQAVRGIVFDQLRYEYNWGGAIHIGATDLGALVFDNPGVLPSLLHASPHIFPSIVFRSDAADITNTNVRVIIIVDGVHIYTDVPVVEPIMGAAFGFMAPFFIVDDYYEYVPVVEEEVYEYEVYDEYEEYEEEIYEEYEEYLEYEVYETHEDEEVYEESEAGIAAYALGAVFAAAAVLGAH